MTKVLPGNNLPPPYQGVFFVVFFIHLIMPALQIKATQKQRRDFRRKATESAKSIADMAKEIVIV